MNRASNESFNEPKIKVNCTDRRASNASVAVSIKLGNRRRDSHLSATKTATKMGPPSITDKLNGPVGQMNVTRSNSKKAKRE